MKSEPSWYTGTSGYMVSKKIWDILELNSLEINSTFYRIPKNSTWETWYNNSPDNFIFSMKMNKTATHFYKLSNPEKWLNEFLEKAYILKEKLGIILFQLPPSFHYSDQNIEKIKKLSQFLPSKVDSCPNIGFAFEFRDESWIGKKDIVKIFKKNNWAIAGTAIRRTHNEKKAWMGTMPSGIYIPPITANFSYIRFHGGSGFRGYYDETELTITFNKIKGLKTRKNFTYFNNTFFSKRGDSCIVKNNKIWSAAVCDAYKFKLITKQ